MSEQMVKLLGDLAVVLSPLLIAGLSWLSLKVAGLINEKVKSQALQSILIKLDTAIFSVIGDLEQTVVQKLKEASKDGKLSPEEIADIKATVLAKLKGYVSFDELGKLLGATDVAGFVASRVESAVGQLRRADPQ